MRKQLVVFALASAVAGVVAALPMGHRRIVQSLAVTATVVPSALIGFEVVAQPVTITQRDMERGYVDVVMKSHVRVRGARGMDAPPQLVLAMEPRSDLFKSVIVTAVHGNDRGNGRSDVPAQQVVAEPGTPIEGRVAEFHYRFQLADAAKPGGYGTAISVSVDL